MISKKEIEDLYINKKLTQKAIGEHFGVTESSIQYLMKKYDIPTRSRTIEIPPKEYLKKLHYGDGKTLKEISFMYNVNRNLVSKWFAFYGLEINYFKTKNRPPYDDIYELYENKRLSIKELGKIYNVERRIVNKWLDYYGIEIRSPQRKYAHLRKVPLTNIQKEFIVGTLLGDAYLAPSNRLELKHSIKQLSYLLHKKEIMSNYINYVRFKTDFLKKTNKEYITCCCHTIQLPELEVFRNMFYVNNKKVIKECIAKYLTPFAMAIWYMDDGWRHKNGMRISSESFTEKEHQTLKWLIKMNFDINVKVCGYTRFNKDYNYLSFNKRNSGLLEKLIEPYIIESMKYKLPFLND